VAELRVVAEGNPYHHRAARRLGFALREAGHPEESVVWFERALELGGNSNTDMYNLACIYAVTGKTEKALEWLERSLDAGFVEDETILGDSDMDSLRKLPRFKAITGLYPPDGLSRDDKWRYDLDFFARRMERMHWDLYAKISKDEFAREVTAIKDAVPGLTESQVRARLRKVLERVGDGHTLMRARMEGDTVSVRYPLDLYRFTDGIFVRGVPKEHERALGCRVVKLGSLTADAAYVAMKAYLSVDNEMGYRDYVGSALVSPDILEGIGAVKAGENLVLTLEKPGAKAFTMSVPVARYVASTLSGPRLPGYVYANEASKAPLPFWQKNAGTTLWFEHDAARKLVYAWVGAVDDMEGKTFEQFCTELFGFINSNGVENLVLDLRMNGGGNTGVVLPLIHGLVKCDAVNKEGHLFVITGRRTFSAAMNTCSLIELHTEALFVGEPTGSKPNFVGESTSFVLPCNRYRVYCSSRYWQHVVSEDKRPWIAPDLVAEPAFGDYAANRDPVMEAIWKRLGQ